jgi:hypothetical protein
MRCHSRKPGLLTTGYPYIQSHNIISDNNNNKSDLLNIAIEDFKMVYYILYYYFYVYVIIIIIKALDRCLQAEKILLQKVNLIIIKVIYTLSHLYFMQI